MKIENCQLHYLKPIEFPLWDDFVADSPQGCIYGNSWYLKALQKKVNILTVKEGNRIHAGIILTKNRRETYANPYLCKHLGVYYADFKGTNYNIETKRRKVTDLLLTELTKLPSFDYFFHPTFNTYLPFYYQKFDNRLRYSYWIDFKESSLAIIEANFHTKLRSELKFAEKQNYFLDKTIDFNTCIKLCQTTFIQKGEKFPFSKSFLSAYYRLLREKEVLEIFGLKNKEGEVMAVAALLKYKKVTTLILSGINKAIIERGANEWLIYQCILQAKEQGDAFDFEGSMLPKIESFYRKFGGQYVPYLNIYKNSMRKFLFEQIRDWYHSFKRELVQ